MGVGQSQETISNLETQLSAIQNAVTETRHAVLSQVNTLDRVSTLLSSSAEGKLCMSEKTLSVKPVGLFETLGSFFPETYTLEQRLPLTSLVIIGAYEAFSTTQYRRNMYNFFYMRSHRQWCRLTVSLRIDCSSKYWIATKISKGRLKTRETQCLLSSAQIPISLQRSIQKYLSEIEDLEEDDTISLEEVNRTIGDQSLHHLPARMNRVQSRCQDAVMFLDDLGCPKFIASQVTQIQMLDPPYRFASSLNGTVVYEIRFTCDIPNAELLYNIQVLHSLSGIPGFTKFVGIVVDESQTYMKSYLVKFPRACCRVDQIMQKGDISWKRRERWARQLVKAVSIIHSKGFVIGTQYGFWSPVVIEDTDSIEYWAFRKTFKVGHTVGSYYPPEFLYLREMPPTACEAENPAVTSKTDIFHLGLLLWILAENVSLTQASPWCIREGCNLGREPCRKASHSDPPGLPNLPDGIPEYYKFIVKSCRAKNPEHRIAARRLADFFPAIDEASSASAATSRATSAFDRSGFASLSGGILSRITCDGCGKNCIKYHFFHRNICNTGDFNICLECYSLWRHCYDRDHLLVELKKDEIFTVPRGYHCSPQVSGDRQILEL